MGGFQGTSARILESSSGPLKLALERAPPGLDNRFATAIPFRASIYFPCRISGGFCERTGRRGEIARRPLCRQVSCNYRTARIPPYLVPSLLRFVTARCA